MDSFSLPTLPFIARYDTHSATTSPSAPRYKKWKQSNTGNDLYLRLDTGSVFHSSQAEICLFLTLSNIADCWKSCRSVFVKILGAVGLGTGNIVLHFGTHPDQDQSRVNFPLFQHWDIGVLDIGLCQKVVDECSWSFIGWLVFFRQTTIGYIFGLIQIWSKREFRSFDPLLKLCYLLSNFVMSEARNFKFGLQIGNSKYCPTDDK